MRLTPVSAVRRLVGVGTMGKEAAEARRIRTVNTAVVIAAVATGGFAAFYTASGDPALRPLILILVGFTVILALIIPLNKIVNTVWTASLFGVVGCADVLIATAFLGQQTGFQLYLIPAAGLTALMTRAHQWPVPVGGVVLYVVAFTYIEMAFAEGLIAPYSDAVLDGIFVTSIVGAIAFALLPPLLYRQLVVRAEADLQTARDRAERLLFAILPRAIAHRLGTTDDASDQVIADRFDSVTVLFADIVGFTAQTASMQAESVVARLNRLFSDFDARAQEHGLEKIKTIGDAYMLVGGAPEVQTDHADRVIRMALDMLADATVLAAEVWPGLQLRIGIHSGPAVAGVIGRTKFSYDIWGDTVNTASRLEGQCPPGGVLISDTTKRLLSENHSISGPYPVDIRGKGELTAWRLEGDPA